jgi:hypothetical protein
VWRDVQRQPESSLIRPGYPAGIISGQRPHNREASPTYRAMFVFAGSLDNGPTYFQASIPPAEMSGAWH